MVTKIIDNEVGDEFIPKFKIGTCFQTLNISDFIKLLLKLKRLTKISTNNLDENSFRNCPMGLDYGIANKSGVPLDDELKSILDFAKQIKINMFDTAIQYGNAEERIGKLLNKGNKIVTKIGGFTESNDVNYQIMSSLKRLKEDLIWLFISFL